MKPEVTAADLTDEEIAEYISDLETELAIAQAATKILRGPHRAGCRAAVAAAINARRRG